MHIALFLTLIFLHIAFGLAFAFIVMYFATKTENKALQGFGYFVGSLLIVLAILSMVLGSIFVTKRPHFMHCPYEMHEKMKQEEMMKYNMPQKPEIKEESKEEMNEEKQEENKEKNEKNISYKHQESKSIKGCPIKTKKEIEKELKEGKRTGAACRADMEKPTSTKNKNK